MDTLIKDNFTLKKILKEWLPVTLMVLANLIFGIIFKQKFIKMLPVFITVIVLLLNSRANRYGFLLASVNSIIYSIGYLITGLYGQVASALFQSVLSAVSFFLWKRRAYGNATIFRKLSSIKKILLFLLIIVASTVIYMVNSKLPGSSSPILDSFTFVLGIALTILTMFAFIESPYIQMFYQSLSLYMWIDVIIKNGLQEITYLCSNIYSMYMVIIMTITWTKLYKKQQREKQGENNINPSRDK